jgi:hypothetical protein
VRKVTSVKNIKDVYSKRILSNILNEDPFAVYAKTSGTMLRLTKGLNNKHLRTPLKKGRWSVAQIVSHFCDAEIAMSYRLRMVIAQSGGPIQAYDQDKWSAVTYDKRADCLANIRLFTTLRNANVSLLEHLPSRAWQRYGMHEERGKETVERMVQMLAGHDINHLRQIEQIRNAYLKKSS